MEFIGYDKVGLGGVPPGDEEVTQGHAWIRRGALPPRDNAPYRSGAGIGRGGVAVQVGWVIEDRQCAVAHVVLLAALLAEHAAAEWTAHHARLAQRVGRVREALLGSHAPAAVGAEQTVEVPDRGRLLTLERPTEGVATAEEHVSPPCPLALPRAEAPGRARVAVGRSDSLGLATRLAGLPLAGGFLALLELVPLAALFSEQTLVELGTPCVPLPRSASPVVVRTVLFMVMIMVGIGRRDWRCRAVYGCGHLPAAAQAKLGEGDEAHSWRRRGSLGPGVEGADLGRRFKDRAVPVRQQIAPLGDPLRERRAIEIDARPGHGLLVGQHLGEFADQVVWRDDQGGKGALSAVGR